MNADRTNAATTTTTAADTFVGHARAFAAIHAGAPPAIANVRTHAVLLQAGDIPLPAVVNDGDDGEAWLVSARHTYAGYAAEELARHFPALRLPARGLGAALDGWLARAGIDRAVSINHWLLSTDLYPPLSPVALPALVAQARQRWPGHALRFRSLNDVQHGDWLQALAGLGFRRLPSRQVYLFDDIDALAHRHGDLRRDLKLPDDGRFARVRDADIVDADYGRIAELYDLLYLRKYSRFNPAYSADFVRRWHRAGLLRLHAMRDGDGRLACFAALFDHGGVTTAPLVGYDTAQPRRLALYRRLNACIFDDARRRGVPLHLSAGAAGFKRQRGGVPAVECTLVDARGQPARHRRAVAVLAMLAERIALPLVRWRRL